MKNTLIHVGRSLLGLYFLLPGIMKFASVDTHITLMQTHGIPFAEILLPIAGVVQIVAGLCLLANRQVVVCSLGLAVMALLINANLHDFWNLYEGVDVKHETQNFVKNMGIFAGLLLIAAINMESISQAED